LSIQSLITEHIETWTTSKVQKASGGRGRAKKSNGQSQYGIKKLRELILDLAVRGKLVPQDPNDEPAGVLLEKIAQARNQLLDKKLIKKPKNLDEISEADFPFPKPETWEYVHLNDLGEWGAGATPSRRNSAYYEGNIPWFKSGELVGDVITTSEESITELALNETSVRYNKVGDVLIAMYGATIGKTSILGVPATTNQAVCACTPFEGFSNTYLLTLLKAFKRRFVGMGAGGAQPNISREKLIATVIALPPTAEQHRIVDKVDELMALCDLLEQEQTDNSETHQLLVKTLLDTLTHATDHEDFIDSWQRIEDNFNILFTTPESIDELKQTILQLAVMGKLVQQDPDDEPASELLKRIATKRAQLVSGGKIKKKKPLPKIGEEEKPFELPLSWEWVRLGNITQINPRNSFEDQKETSFIPMPHIWTDHDGKHGQESRLWGEIKKGYTHFANGDIGVAKITPCFENSKAAVFSGLKNGVGAGTTELHVARPFGKTLVPNYIILFLKAPMFLNVGKTKMTGTAGQKRLPKSFFEGNPLPLPPLAEQQRIVARIDELMALCDSINENLIEAQSTQVQLADAIVGQAV
jgi:type I restriction enzyme, S subunit